MNKVSEMSECPHSKGEFIAITFPKLNRFIVLAIVTMHETADRLHSADQNLRTVAR